MRHQLDFEEYFSAIRRALYRAHNHDLAGDEITRMMKLKMIYIADAWVQGTSIESMTEYFVLEAQHMEAE